MKKFSELSQKEMLEDADYVPIVDASEQQLDNKNKVVLFSRIKEFLMREVNANEAQRQQAEASRVQAENARVQAEAAREQEETGYVNQSKSWAVGTNGQARSGDATDNSKYYSELSAHSAEQAQNCLTMVEQYSDILVPTFHIDFETMMLVQDNDAVGITFELTEDKILQYEFDI